VNQNHSRHAKNDILWRNLQSHDAYTNWLHEICSHDGINLILGGKTPCLDDLPFDRNVFTDVKNKLMLHGSIIRVINRNLSCHFSATLQHTTAGDGSRVTHITYNCRTSGSWAGDMALSMTFSPDTLTTNALWLGCNSPESTPGYTPTDADLVSRRLSEFDGEAFHPMLLPTLLADFERDRLVRHVREMDTNFIQKVFDLQYRQDQHLSSLPSISSPTDSPARPPRSLAKILKDPGKILTGFTGSIRSGSTSGQVSPDVPLRAESPRAVTLASDGEPSIQLSIKISHLRNGLSNWRAQLLKMIEHVDELQQMDFGITTFTTAINDNYESKDTAVAALAKIGLRIRRRLEDLVDEHDEFVRKCTHIMEGVTLITQLELAQIAREDAKLNQRLASVNLEVAKLARRDGNLMKSLTLLGMIFLPGTFVATFFSMDFFNWPIQDNKVVSSYIWIYVVMTSCLTALCLAAFYSCVQKRGKVSTPYTDSPA
jgi:hypothetical protein